MKRILGFLTGFVVFAAAASAALLIDEPFNYADGFLTQVSSTWSNYSGSTLQVDVTSGRVNVSQLESEDLQRLIPGSPYGTNGFLYASFTMNMSQLPVGIGGYFACFKDDGTQNLKGRVFVTTLGADANTYRVGVANHGNTSTNIPFNLALNTDFKIVVRWDTTNQQATLWINPSSEDSLINRADAFDGSTFLTAITRYVLRQSTSSGNGMGVLTMDDLKIGTAFSDVVTPGDPSRNPPVVSAIGDQVVGVNQPTPAIPFTVNDGETAPSNLVVAASSSNQALVPNANIVLGGNGTDRTVTVTPASGQQGRAVISITVTDGDNNQTLRSFTVTVGAPGISSVPNQVTPLGTATASIPFTVSDSETPAAILTLSAWSSNPTLIPTANVAFGGSGSNRTAVITPAAGQRGSAYVSFIVSDGASTASNRFTLTVAPTVTQDMDETFSYPDGLVQDVSAQLWSVFSPQTPSNDCRVVSGRLLLVGTNADDVRYQQIGWYDIEGNGWYNTNGGYVVYYSLTLNVAELPTSSTYFSLLKDNFNVNYRARAFVSTNGAAPGHYRVGVAAASATTTTYITNDLAPNANYTITVRYNVGTGDTRLWLNAASEAYPGVDAIDSAPVVDIYNFVFRQNTGLGALYVDNVKVGTAWSQVYQAPNWPPTMSDLPDVTTPYQTATPAFPFTVGDLETAAGSLVLTASSDNPALVPISSVTFGGSGANRTVTVTPANGRSGQARISVTVSDAGSNSVTASFLVTVLGLNNPPAISTIPNQSTVMGVPTAAIPFTVSDLETPAANLTLSGSSGNTSLVPNANIVFAGSGSNRTVTVTPAGGQVGVANISVVVSDGVYRTTNTFALTVGLNVLLADAFNDPDGSIITNSSFLWNAHSGATGQTWVAGGQLLLSGLQTEDINAALTNAPYYPSNAPVLYAGFTAKFSVLPTNAYFAHFKDATTGFRCKVFGSTSNAAPGAFRLGVANAANTLGVTNLPLARDLVLNVPYRVVVRYHVATAASALWVNAAAESDSSVTAADATTTQSISAFAFRQTTGMGDLAVDDLVVGATFDAVRGEVPAAPPVMAITRTDYGVRLEWPASATTDGYLLQRKGALDSGSWAPAGLAVDTAGGTSSVSVTNPVGNAFFRLSK